MFKRSRRGAAARESVTYRWSGRAVTAFDRRPRTEQPQRARLRRAFCTFGSAVFVLARALARKTTDAGLAAIVISSPVAGFLPALEEARDVFAAFDEKLGPVGAAKALHLLAPRFFPLWDTKIAKEYLGGGMKKAGKNADRYLRFMELVQGQCERLPDARTLGRYQLRALDEFNYCRYTKNWRC